MTDLPNQTAIHVQAGKAVLGGFICYIAEPGFLYRSNGEFFSVQTYFLSECLQELVNLFFGPVLERLLGTDSTLHHRVYSGMLWGSKKCFW